MNRREALALRAFSVWTVVVWAVFIKNVVVGGDGSAGARTVHGVLAVVSLAFAVVAWNVVSRVRKRA